MNRAWEKGLPVATQLDLQPWTIVFLSTVDQVAYNLNSMQKWLLYETAKYLKATAVQSNKVCDYVLHFFHKN